MAATHIITHHWIQSIYEGAVLVRSGDYLQLATVVKHQPCPARTKTFSSCIVECRLECIKRTKCCSDGIPQFARGLTTTIPLQNLPEHTVVKVTTTVVAYRCTGTLRYLVQTTDYRSTDKFSKSCPFNALFRLVSAASILLIVNLDEGRGVRLSEVRKAKKISEKKQTAERTPCRKPLRLGRNLILLHN